MNRRHAQYFTIIMCIDLMDANVLCRFPFHWVSGSWFATFSLSPPPPPPISPPFVSCPSLCPHPPPPPNNFWFFYNHMFLESTAVFLLRIDGARFTKSLYFVIYHSEWFCNIHSGCSDIIMVVVVVICNSFYSSCRIPCNLFNPLQAIPASSIFLTRLFDC